MMRKHALYLAAVLLLGGCFSSSAAKRYFQIVPMDTNVQPHAQVGKAVYVEPVRVDPLYDDFRVIYRVSPYELKYYSSIFWAKKPDALIREAVSDYFIQK